MKKWTADDVTDEQCNYILHGVPPWTQKDRERAAADLNSTGTFCDSTEMMKLRNRTLAVHRLNCERVYLAVKRMVHDAKDELYL
jgi:hypothetical protein